MSSARTGLRFGRLARGLLAAGVATGAAAALAVLISHGVERGGDPTLMASVGAFGLVLATALGYDRLADRLRRTTHRMASLELSEFKDEFAARVGHDLRTPLTSIVGYARLLDIEGLSDGESEAVRTVVSQSAEMSRMIDELMTASEMDAGSLKLRARAVSMRGEVDVASEFVRLLGAGVRIDCRDAEVKVDPERFRQLIRRLLVDTYHDGSPEIVVRGQSGPGGYILQIVAPGTEPARAETDLAFVVELAQRMGCRFSRRHINGENHLIVEVPLAASECRSRGGPDASALAAVLPRRARAGMH